MISWSYEPPKPDVAPRPKAGALGLTPPIHAEPCEQFFGHHMIPERRETFLALVPERFKRG